MIREQLLKGVDDANFHPVAQISDFSFQLSAFSFQLVIFRRGDCTPAPCTGFL
jgi:hypothetical protein